MELQVPEPLPPLVRVPFALRRAGLFAAGVRADRDRPDLARIRSAEPAEQFVWDVLPHAARSFAPCIVALPSSIALPVAVGYLYCRVLDTYEDLVQDTAKRALALTILPLRLDQLMAGAQPQMLPDVEFACVDKRDAAHVMLAEEVPRLDSVFRTFSAPVQQCLGELVQDMSDGMRWAAETFERQEGTLSGSLQLSQYCMAVLGNPIRFAARLFRWHGDGGVQLSAETEAAARDVGEFLQLANVTRDVEKDLLRGVCYHPALHSLALDRDDSDKELIRSARAALTDRAISLAPSYLRLIEGMGVGRGLLGASALMMLRFTEQHYHVTAARALGISGPKVSGKSVILKSLPAALSGAWGLSQMGRSLARLHDLRRALPAQTSSMYLS